MFSGLPLICPIPFFGLFTDLKNMYFKTFFLFFLMLAPASFAGADEAEPLYVQTKNIVFAEEYGVGLLLDVFRPTGKSNGLAIVDVVSGSWHSNRAKLRDHKRAQMFDIFCGRGFTVFAIRPGSLPKFTVTEMVAHAADGVRWVKQHAQEYQIDPNHLGITGASAGGHLACLVAVTNGRSATEGASADASVCAAGVCFPPTDFLDYGGVKIEVRVDNGLGGLLCKLAFPLGVEHLTDEQIEQRIVSISPARLVKENAPPFLLIHGSGDFIVPLQQSKNMLAALQEKKVPAELIIKKLGGHPWPTIHEEVAVLADWFEKTLAPTASP